MHSMLLLTYIYTHAHMHAHMTALTLYKAILWIGTLLAREKNPWFSKAANFLKSSKNKILAT